MEDILKMETRQLKRSDLPKTRRSVDSLHIPVIHKGENKWVCDIHMDNDTLCWLEDAAGIPTTIAELQLLQGMSAYEMEKETERLSKKISEYNIKINTLTKQKTELLTKLRAIRIANNSRFGK